MNKITSVTLHKTGEGQRLSYTYSVINEETYKVTSENNRGSLIIPPVPQTENILQAISSINEFALQNIE